MKTIYDEAIKESKCVWNGNYLSYPSKTIKALERAKKEHELLELYKKKEQCIVCAPLFKDSSILHCVVRYSDDEKYMRILNQIKQLEEELK